VQIPIWFCVSWHEQWLVLPLVHVHELNLVSLVFLVLVRLSFVFVVLSIQQMI